MSKTEQQNILIVQKLKLYTAYPTSESANLSISWETVYQIML